MNSKKDNGLKKIIYSRATVALLIIVVLFLVHSVWDIFWKYRGSIAVENQLKSQLSNIEAERVYLASSTEALQSQSGIQYELKENFGACGIWRKRDCHSQHCDFGRSKQIFLPRIFLIEYCRGLKTFKCEISLVAEHVLPKHRARFRLPHLAKYFAF